MCARAPRVEVREVLEMQDVQELQEICDVQDPRIQACGLIRGMRVHVGDIQLKTHLHFISCTVAYMTQHNFTARNLKDLQ